MRMFFYKGSGFQNISQDLLNQNCVMEEMLILSGLLVLLAAVLEKND